MRKPLCLGAVILLATTLLASSAAADSKKDKKDKKGDKPAVVKKITVPRLTGMSIAKARALLTEAGFKKIEAVENRNKKMLEKLKLTLDENLDLVATASPRGRVDPETTTIKLTPRRFNAPSYLKLTPEDARKRMELYATGKKGNGVKLTLEIDAESVVTTSKRYVGRIASQDPKPGKMLGSASVRVKLFKMKEKKTGAGGKK